MFRLQANEIQESKPPSLQGHHRSTEDPIVQNIKVRLLDRFPTLAPFDYLSPTTWRSARYEHHRRQLLVWPPSDAQIINNLNDEHHHLHRFCQSALCPSLRSIKQLLLDQIVAFVIHVKIFQQVHPENLAPNPSSTCLNYQIPPQRWQCV
jgi:hypothetical protein